MAAREQGFVNPAGPGIMRISPDGSGMMKFGADEGNEVSGRGKLFLNSDTLNGHLYFYMDDDWAFTARRESLSDTNG